MIQRYFLRIIPYDGKGIYLIQEGGLSLPYIDVTYPNDMPERKLTETILCAVQKKYYIFGVLLKIESLSGRKLCYIDEAEDLIKIRGSQIKKCAVHQISEVYQRLMVEHFDLLLHHYRCVELSPWEASGWFPMVVRWVKEQLLCRKEVLQGVPVQIKGAWPRSTVLRIKTKNTTYYLKWGYLIPPAEHKVICFLAKFVPQMVPSVIATHDTRNMFIMEEFLAVEKKYINIQIRIQAVKAFSSIQIASIAHVMKLKHWGCMSLDGLTLYRYFNEFMRDKSLFQYGLSKADTKKMKSISLFVERDCKQLLTAICPITLNNEDFQDGNIAMQNKNVVIYDWANTFLAHPFFSFHYYLYRYRDDMKLFEKSDGELKNSLQMLVKHYLTPWCKKFTDVWNIIEEWKITTRLFWLVEAIKCKRERQYINSNSEWDNNISYHIVQSIRSLCEVYESEINRHCKEKMKK